MMRIFLLLLILSSLESLYSLEYTSLRDRFERNFMKNCVNSPLSPLLNRWKNLIENPTKQKIHFFFHMKNLKNGGIGDRIAGLLHAINLSLRYNRTLVIEADNGLYDYFRPYYIEKDEEGDKISSYSLENSVLWSNLDSWAFNYEDEDEEEEQYSDYVEEQEEDEEQEEEEENDEEEENEDEEENDDEGEPAPKKHFNYEDYLTFLSNGTIVKNPQAPEKFFNLMNCVDANPKIRFREKMSAYCGLDQIPANKVFSKYDHIFLASNRYYLCRQIFSPENPSVAVKELRAIYDDENQKIRQKNKLKKKTAKKKKEVNLDFGSLDLYSVSGCLLRLALWPTETLWADVDNWYQGELDSFYFTVDGDKPHIMRRKSQNVITTYMDKPRTSKPSPGKLIMNNKTYKKLFDWSEYSYSNHPRPPYQIGAHFRCGDAPSFPKSGSFEENGHACLAEPDATSEFIIAYKSYYLLKGTPIGIGQCIEKTHNFYKEYYKKTETALITLEPRDFGNFPQFYSFIHSQTSYNHTILFSTSDHVAASSQIVEYANVPVSIRSPQGCHIEYTDTKECFKFTLVHWFAFSLSQIMFSQTFGEFSIPTSAFSRYAGIYSLPSADYALSDFLFKKYKKFFPETKNPVLGAAANKTFVYGGNENLFRSGMDCLYEISTLADASLVDQGNWICNTRH